MTRTTRPVKVSDILHHAADQCLSPALDDVYIFPGHGRHFCSRKYSCNAIRDAAYYLCADGDVASATHDVILRGVTALGVSVHSVAEFDDVPHEHRQAARYQWLKFCALLAEEQGE